MTTLSTPSDRLAQRRLALEAEIARLDAHADALAVRRDLAREIADAPDAATARLLVVQLAGAIDREQEAERAVTEQTSPPGSTPSSREFRTAMIQSVEACDEWLAANADIADDVWPRTDVLMQRRAMTASQKRLDELEASTSAPEEPAPPVTADEVVTLPVVGGEQGKPLVGPEADPEDAPEVRWLRWLLYYPDAKQKHPKTAAALAPLLHLPDDPTEAARIIEAVDLAGITIGEPCADGFDAYEKVRPLLIRTMRGLFVTPTALALKETLKAAAEEAEAPKPAKKPRGRPRKTRAGVKPVPTPGEIAALSRDVVEAWREPAADVPAVEEVRPASEGGEPSLFGDVSLHPTAHGEGM